MLKHITQVGPEFETGSPSWFLAFNLLGDCAIIEGYSIDIIEISDAATEADYYA